jgi:hypothetical protein
MPRAAPRDVTRVKAVRDGARAGTAARLRDERAREPAVSSGRRRPGSASPRGTE